VHGAGLLAKEVPGRIVGCCCLGNLAVLLWLDRMDEIRELDSILDKEDGNVVADNI
jgi:hypothetical protein